MNEYRFCPVCGQPLVLKPAGGRLRQACDACGWTHWHNPVPAAAVALLRGEDLLWVRRSAEPRRGQWSLPSGFQEWEEDIRDCARRELREETGLEARLGSLLGVYSVFDDPRNNALLAVYLAEPAGGAERAADDASELGWFPVDAPPEPIAWEPHRRALADLRRRLAAAGGD